MDGFPQLSRLLLAQLSCLSLSEVDCLVLCTSSAQALSSVSVQQEYLFKLLHLQLTAFKLLVKKTYHPSSWNETLLQLLNTFFTSKECVYFTMSKNELVCLLCSLGLFDIVLLAFPKL